MKSFVSDRSGAARDGDPSENAHGGNWSTADAGTEDFAADNSTAGAVASAGGVEDDEDEGEGGDAPHLDAEERTRERRKEQRRRTWSRPLTSPFYADHTASRCVDASASIACSPAGLATPVPHGGGSGGASLTITQQLNISPMPYVFDSPAPPSTGPPSTTKEDLVGTSTPGPTTLRDGLYKLGFLTPPTPPDTQLAPRQENGKEKDKMIARAAE
jgi:hypothetical protein